MTRAVALRIAQRRFGPTAYLHADDRAGRFRVEAWLDRRFTPACAGTTSPVNAESNTLLGVSDGANAIEAWTNLIAKLEAARITTIPPEGLSVPANIIAIALVRNAFSTPLWMLIM
jgi:hypothetical protein